MVAIQSLRPLVGDYFGSEAMSDYTTRAHVATTQADATLGSNSRMDPTSELTSCARSAAHPNARRTETS